MGGGLTSGTLPVLASLCDHLGGGGRPTGLSGCSSGWPVMVDMLKWRGD